MSRPLLAEDLYSIRLPEDPRVAPDGSLVAYTEMSIDRASYEYRRSIWVVEPAGGKPRRFTSGDRDSSPCWSPDSAWLAFVRAPAPEVKAHNEADAARGVGKPQLWAIPTSGGEARQLTFERHGAGAPTWSPDSTKLLFTAEVGDPDDPEAERAQLEDRKVPAVRHIVHLFSRFDGQGWIYERRSHLFEVDLAGGPSRQLTDGDWNDAAPAYSPDGTRVAFSSGRRDDRWTWPGSDIWVLDLSGGGLTQLTLGPTLLASGAAWSPDGRRIAFTAEPMIPSDGHEDLYAMPANEPREPTPLLADFLPACTDSCIDDMRAGHGPAQLEWSADGSEILFLASTRGTTQLFAAPSGGGSPRQLTNGRQRVYGFGLDASQRTLAMAASTPLIPGDLWVQDLRGKPEAISLTRLNQDLLTEVELVTPREIEAIAAGGPPLQAWVMPSAGPGDRAAVLEIHGGPHGMYGESFFFEFQLLASRGYTVVYGNPRGSTGYGRDFSGAIRGDWGGVDYEDVTAIIDAAIAEGGIDPARLGVAGGSYGGYMTNWIVGHTDRFKAAITMRCLSNFATFFATSDIGWWLVMNDFDDPPWANLAFLMERSPITYVANVQTPLLIMHSENDLRCPINEAEQFFGALKFLDREVEMLRFEGQSHDLSRNGHPRSRLVRLNRIVEWFDRHLGIAVSTEPART